MGLECYNWEGFFPKEQEMKRIRLMAFVVLLLAAPGLAGVRGTDWGMSKKQVRQIEGSPRELGKDRLVYEDRLDGLKVGVVYRFNHREELYSITYDFYMNKKERFFMIHALRQFDRISEILREKYGPPESGDAYSDRDKKIATLVSKEPIIEGWEMDDGTYMDHMLEYKDVYNHALVYGHRRLTDEYEELAKQKEMEKF